MTRRVWVYRDGQMVEKGTEPDVQTGVTFMPDLPDFVSPIDGKLYRGRAGMREHNALHNVVPTADLKGLPHQRPQVQPSKVEIREAIQKVMYQKGYLK